MSKYPLFFVIAFSVMSACKEEMPDESASSVVIPDERVGADRVYLENEAIGSATSSAYKTIDELTYHVHAIGALDYLQRKGESVSSQDLASLKRESVFMLELSIPETHKDLFNAKSATVGKDDAIQYLIGKIIDDFSVEQNGKRFNPNGCAYEGQIGGQNKVRVSFYMKDIDVASGYSVEYYDRLFGNGIVKLKSSNKNKIS